MQKFLYITDPHYGSKPLSRKDNYNKSILGKLEATFKLARKIKAVLLIGGDLFDKPNINFFDLIFLVELLKRYPDVRVVVNRGNPGHDGHKENSPLTLLEQSGLIETSDKNDFIDFAGVRVIMAPNSVEPDSRDIYINKHVQNILMTHHLLVDSPTIYDHYLMEDFVTDCEIVLCADYHPYQGIIKYNETVFVAPGSIARRKLTKDNVDKTIYAVEINDFDIKLHKIPFTKDVWVDKSEKSIAMSEMDVEEFREELDSFDCEMNLESAWDVFVVKNNISDDISKYIKGRLFK